MLAKLQESLERYAEELVDKAQNSMTNRLALHRVDLERQINKQTAALQSADSRLSTY